MDKEDLFDAVLERPHQDHLAEGHPGAGRLDAPPDALQREALLQRVIEALEHRRDQLPHCLADRRAGRSSAPGARRRTRADAMPSTRWPR